MKIFIFAFIKKLAYLCAAMLVTYALSYFNTVKAADAYYNPYTNTYSTTAQIACETALPLINGGAIVYTFHSVETSAPYVCFFTDNANPPYTSWLSLLIKGQPFNCTAPEVFSFTTNTCSLPPTCIAPQVLNTTTNTCETPNECLALKGIGISSHTYSPVSEPPSSVCKNNCEANQTDLVICVLPQPNSTAANCFGTYKFTGVSCTPNSDVAVPNPTPEQECIKKGQSYGTVNGVVVCAKAGAVGTTPVTSSTTGTKTTTTETGTTGTTTNTTNNTATNTTTKTTTTTNPDGTTSTKTEQQDTSSFCADNPNSQICTPAEDLCQKNPDIPACKAWCDKDENADKISCIAKGDDVVPDEIVESDFDLNFSPVGGIPSAAGCPPTESISIGGRSIPISYEWICLYASAFKFLVLIFSWISAAYIVSAAVNAD